MLELHAGQGYRLFKTIYPLLWVKLVVFEIMGNKALLNFTRLIMSAIFHSRRPLQLP
jgi:hypothetical protein